MATKGKSRGKIRIKRKVALVNKKDKTRVVTPDTLKPYPTKRTIKDNGATFKVKIRKK
jgi:hypothetical protein